MGRNVYNELKLLNLYPFTDDNIIISKSLHSLNAKNTTVLNNIEDSLKYSKFNNIYIIGGYNIYKYFLQYATHMLITEIYANYDGDVFFPKFNKNNWKEKSKKKLYNIYDSKNLKYVDISFIDYIRH